MLKEKLQEDLTQALKAGQHERRSVLGMLMAAVKNRELEKRSKLAKARTPADQLDAQSKLADEEIIEVVASEIKKRKESAVTYEQADRSELAAKEQSELVILSKYLPAQLSDDEVRAHVKDAIQELNAQGEKDMGKVIGAVRGRVKGKTDGQTVSRIVREELVR